MNVRFGYFEGLGFQEQLGRRIFAKRVRPNHETSGVSRQRW